MRGASMVHIQPCRREIARRAGRIGCVHSRVLWAVRRVVRSTISTGSHAEGLATYNSTISIPAGIDPTAEDLIIRVCGAHFLPSYLFFVHATCMKCRVVLVASS